MREFLPVVIAVAVSIAPVSDSRADAVVVFADSLGIACDLVDNVPGVHDVYVLHWASDALGVRFRLEASPGMTMTYLSEEHFAPTIGGDTQSGITFCYGSCRGDVVVLAKVTYMGHGTSAECCEIRVAPYPGSNTVDLLICGGYPWFADGGVLFLNNFGGCSEPVCPTVYYGPADAPHSLCQPVRTEPSTWGAIKSLYQ